MLMVLAASTDAFAQYEAQVPDDMMNLERTVAGGMLLQMDKATVAYQIVLWNKSECRIYVDLDCYLRLPAACHCKESVSC